MCRHKYRYKYRYRYRHTDTDTDTGAGTGTDAGTDMNRHTHNSSVFRTHILKRARVHTQSCHLQIGGGSEHTSCTNVQR